jgi:hypothetical protein
MELSRYVDEPTIAALKRLLPNAEFEPILEPLSGSSEPVVSIELPAPVEAQYSFVLTFKPEKQISARLLNTGPAERPYFWYMPFEDGTFRNSLELDKAFVETLGLLVTHKTRIVQKRGLINHSFRCDYQTVSGWKRVFGLSALRVGGFRPPRISGRQQVYFSPAIAPR